jgi:hypothetical protein
MNYSLECARRLRMMSIAHDKGYRVHCAVMGKTAVCPTDMGLKKISEWNLGGGAAAALH